MLAERVTRELKKTGQFFFRDKSLLLAIHLKDICPIRKIRASAILHLSFYFLMQVDFNAALR